MKYLLTLLALLPALYLCAQPVPPSIAPEGGGAYPIDRQYAKCLSETDRLFIREEINRSRVGGRQTATAVSLQWPLAPAPALDWPNYYGISGYVDHDSGSGTQSYACDDRTYNGHRGTDFFTWPFPFYLQENDLVQVVAAAAGTIIFRRDGMADENCVWGSQQWNAVYVQHDDGSVAWYGHLKRGSLTGKQTGDRVAAGEYLGIVGSSGRSSGPHLHFELYDAENNLVDPYAGDCNARGGASWWLEQEPHEETRINAIMTHSAAPAHNCPGNQERSNFSDRFDVGQTIYLGLYLKDQRTGDRAVLRLLDPAGEEAVVWTNEFRVDYNASWWWWSRDLPVDAPLGNWTFEVELNGRTERHPFVYGSVVSTVLPPEIDEATSVFPNPVATQLRIESPVTFERAEVLGTDGRLLLSTAIDGQSYLDVSSVPRGVVTVRLVGKAGYLLRRVVRQ